MALKGLQVVELAGLAPGPMCGMILADFGANVVRVDRVGTRLLERDTLCRGKLSISVDLKKEEGISIVRKLSMKSDVLIEPFRKGVMEKLGLGPKNLMSDNPSLIYARLTGYGQNGPMSERAGHDINFLGLSGVLSTLGGTKPLPPMNLLADFAGGSLMCALGILMALNERHRSGIGQVIDASMVEGAAYLSSFLWTSRGSPLLWPSEEGVRGKNLLDGGAAIYNTYETKDGKFMAVGALEPQFAKKLFDGLELGDQDDMFDVFDDELKALIAKKFLERSQAEWCEVFEGVDACVTPVCGLTDAASHHHNCHRKTFTQSGVGILPLPAPRLDRTPAQPENYEIVTQGQHTVKILKDLGYNMDEIETMIDNEIVDQS